MPGNRQKRGPAHAPYSVVVPAAGTGNRMGGCRKPFLELLGRPILQHTVERLRAAEGCAEIIVVLHPDECRGGGLQGRLPAAWRVDKVVPGGSTRQQSALAGLEAVHADLDVVLLHDAVRPLINPDVVSRVAEAARAHGGAVAALRATDTVKEVGNAHMVSATPPRDKLWMARTPQGFRKDIILAAHHAARDDGFIGTDDAQLVERQGDAVVIVEDDYDNIKITTAEDLTVAEASRRWRSGIGGGEGGEAQGAGH
jgi:2-C-methyl-D-erythritol 4-phosphate cytidylyltransferase